eukprot:m51a1_g4021 hypothetical protein (156) ;mRNA; r:586445-587533
MWCTFGRRLLCALVVCSALARLGCADLEAQKRAVCSLLALVTSASRPQPPACNAGSNASICPLRLPSPLPPRFVLACDANNTNVISMAITDGNVMSSTITSRLTGVIPPSLLSLTNLQRLTVTATALTGGIPPLYGLTKLTSLYINGNWNLGGNN